MQIHAVAHQFEIRYKKLINFRSIIDEKIAPFSKTAKDITIENEFTKDLNCNLMYDNHFIHIRYDRMVFRYEGTWENVLNLTKSGSIVDHPFFRIFETLKEDPAFGEVLNYLCYSLVVNISEKDFKTEQANFIEKNLNAKNLNYFLDDVDDVAYIIEKKNNNKVTNITTGPYKGIEDIKKRNIEVQPKTKALLEDKSGQMADIRIHDLSANVSFQKYKEMIQNTADIIKHLWN